MEWITTVVVELHSGTSLQIGEEITYEISGKEYKGKIAAFFPGNPQDGPGIRIDVNLKSYVQTNRFSHEIFARQVTKKADKLIKW